ncbi:MAG: hypothetical protein IJY03_10020 [Prevotella sp.]|nr:hypothetical protein [Prevotella sp.]
MIRANPWDIRTLHIGLLAMVSSRFYMQEITERLAEGDTLPSKGSPFTRQRVTFRMTKGHPLEDAS